MTVFFTSDTHFGHAAARSFYRRPFASTEEMDEMMIARWNAAVGTADEVWHLGDFAKGARPAAIATALARLAGRKHLITGNNDGPATTGQPDWASVAAYAEIEVESSKLVLCHYPFRTWRDMGRGALDLHGHSHGRLKGQAGQVDVGVDVWGFRPVTLSEIRLRRARGAARAPAG